MTDKISEFQYEAATLANEQLGDAKNDNGKRILGTEEGEGPLDTYETAMGAQTDTLTGLLNRLGWEEQMSKYYEIAIRDKRAFSIVMMDLDDFKDVNDTQGHPAGDLILEKFGKAVLARFRKADICGRYGGDEGIAMLTTGDLEQNKIDNQEKEITTELSEKAGIGVSVGIVNWDGHSSLEETIKKADERLYVNKNKRNNNV